MPRDVVIGLGRRIRERRLAQGMKLATLARKAGITSSYLCELETTEGRSPSAVILCRIADALDTSVQQLLDLAGRPAARDGAVIPPSLSRARAVYRFSEDEVTLLSGIEYRGRRPQSEEDWFFLLCAIRRAVR